MKNLKKVVVTLLLVVGLGTISGCGNKRYDEAIQDGITSLNVGEPEKAEVYFENALKEKSDDNDAKKLLNYSKNYQKVLDMSNYKDLPTLEEDINTLLSFKYEGLKDDKNLEELKKETIDKKNLAKKYEEVLSKSESLSKGKKYSDSNKDLDELLKVDPDDQFLISYKTKAESLKQNNDSEIKKEQEAKAKKEAEEKAAKEKAETEKKALEEAQAKAAEEEKAKQESIEGNAPVGGPSKEFVVEAIKDGTYQLDNTPTGTMLSQTEIEEITASISSEYGGDDTTIGINPEIYGSVNPTHYVQVSIKANSIGFTLKGKYFIDIDTFLQNEMINGGM